MTETASPKAPKGAAKKRGNPGPKHLSRASKEIKLAEAAFQRDDGRLEEKLVKLRSCLCICIPGLEKQIRSSKGLDEPGVRDHLIACKFRV